MKPIKIVSIVILLFLINITKAQVIENYNFENFNYTGGSCVDNHDVDGLPLATAPFQACDPTDVDHLSYWVPSHGTPETWMWGGHQALMWTGYWRYDDYNLDTQVRGEGLMVFCSWFEEGKVYNLSLKLKANSAQNIDHAYIDLVDDLDFLHHDVPASYDVTDGSYDIPVSTDKQNLADYSIAAGNTITRNITFIPDKDYRSLWIHPYSAKADPIAVLYIDDVVIDECLSDITYNNISNTLPSLTIREDFIKTLNTVEVTSGQDVTFTAGNYIEMNPGFDAKEGSIFEAYIAGCSPLECSNGNTKSKHASSLSANTTIKKTSDKIKLYPNPFTDKADLEYHFEDGHGGILEIYSLLGNKKASYPLSSNQDKLTITSEDLEPNVYIYKITVDGNIVYTDKLIVVK